MPTPTLEDAILIATLAHKAQRDKGGRPYILHPLKLMLEMQSETEQMVAVLHDVVEDAPAFPLSKLKNLGYPDDVIEALDCLTKREGEDYDAFIARIKPNAIARRVKLADLAHNMEAGRLIDVTVTDRTRLEKYRRAREELAR